MVELRRDLADLPSGGPFLLGRRAATARLDDVDMSSLGELAHGPGNVRSSVFMRKANTVTAFAASEAVPQLKRGVDLNDGLFLVMKRATAPEVAPALLHRASLPDDRDDVARLRTRLMSSSLIKPSAKIEQLLPHTFNRAPPPSRAARFDPRTRINFRRFRERDAPSTVERPHLTRAPVDAVARGFHEGSASLSYARAATERDDTSMALT